MAFEHHQNTDRRQPTYINNILAKDSTTFTHGESLIVDSTGRWDVAVAGAKVGGVFAGTTFTSTTDTPIEVIECTAGDIFIADYTGTPDATFLPGMQTADIASGGLVLASADVTGGAWAILKVDTTNTKAWVRPKLRQFS